MQTKKKALVQCSGKPRSTRVYFILDKKSKSYIMKTIIPISILLLLICLPAVSTAQVAGDFKTTRKPFPLTLGIQFENLALPFYDLESNFSHPGWMIGTEVNLNRRKNLQQQFQAAFYLNKETGNGFYLVTQTAYRPALFRHISPEIKLGAGWQRIYHPVRAYEFRDGSWKKTAGGKSQLIIPLGFSLEYHAARGSSHVVPYAGLQLIPALFYNDAIPLNFYTLFQAGVTVQL